ncbi:MAG TPA: NAD(P)-dependent oxidoreductase [Mycobacteriales bacterium]|jgi:3-hydroxyisobutyrate dehydrogenase-like beta-hydroxyacid dehydrogenase|nr:NAD(P)-dependent oxidoreductase [Mycobacteriales bacterium]
MTDQDFGVAVVGLGQIGAGLASRLVDWPGGLTVYDVRAEAAAPLVEKGARAAADLGEVAAARVISIVVLNDGQVRDVVGELLRKVAPGTVIAIHSTIDAETAPELAARGDRLGVHVLDVALTGGHFAVLEGRLVAMVGGDEAAHRLAEPVFARWAEHQLHFGPSGSGIRAKLARNMLQFIGYAATGEISRLAEAAGVDLLKLAAAIRHSDAVIGGPSVVMISPTTAAYPADDPLRPIFENTRELGEKDLSHALALGDALGVDLPFGRLGLASLATALRVPHQMEDRSEGR